MNINYDIFRMTQKQLKQYLCNVLKQSDYKPICKDGFLFAQGTIPVLLVAHMDTVHKKVPKDICVSDTGIIMSPQGIGGDDRCGIMAILEIIQHLKCSVLFTEDEEIGCVGASKFANTKICKSLDVNFIVEIDRRGSNDAVFYECDNPEFQSTIEQYGFVTKYGSFSDICVIAPEMGVAAVNISSGYYNEHQIEEYVNINELFHNIDRLIDLITNNCDNYFQYMESDHAYYYDEFSYLPEGSIIVLENGQTIEYDSYSQDLFIGTDNLLYWYDYETGNFMHLPNVRAYDTNGIACKFDENLIF